MALMTSYLMTTKNLEAFLNTIQGAKAPERFTNKFLTDLEFKSTNDRLFIGMLKGLGFLDDNGVPSDRYFEFLDQSNANAVLADAIREAYEDLFAVNVNAHEMTESQVKGKLKTLTQGQKSDKVLSLMAKTFIALSQRADFTAKTRPRTVDEDESIEDEPIDESVVVTPQRIEQTGGKIQLHYNIQLILPDARDPKVYDALFTSLKKHLLS